MRGPTAWAGAKLEECVSFGDGPVRLWFRPHRALPDAWLDSFHGQRVLLLGDDAEWEANLGVTNAANAAYISYDAAASSLTVHTSIVGLPPVFAYALDGLTVLASDIHLIASLPDVHLELDPVGVVELGRIGQPVSHRTLFRNTRLLPGGTKVVASRTSGLTMERTWCLPKASPVDWKHFVRTQAEVFADAVRRTEVSASFLSLTAGLDTRTVFATLAEQGRLVPAVTMSGVNRSLDARTAARLCHAYGVSHSIVTIGDQFAADLPGYVEQASRLSGGLASLGQAPEVYFYTQLGGFFDARISGNLGNQVGRGGTEGVGTRGAALNILSPALRDLTPESGHWLLGELSGSGTSAIEFILQQEIPFTSVGNFSIGNHFAVQKSPYANRKLLETLALRPAGGSAPSGSLMKMRFRDLKHRFFGDPASISFQRFLICRINGFAAHYPINYGWRAIGGVSLPGLLWGAATFAGMIVEKQRIDDGLLRGMIERIGLATLHDFQRSARWLRGDLREFTLDTLSSRAVVETGIFDAPVLRRVTDEHFGRVKDHYETVAFALDVALAQRIFCSNS